MTSGDWSGFLYAWLGITACMVAAAVVVLIWAIRTGQFKDQDRARYLALDDQTTDTKNTKDTKSTKKGEAGNGEKNGSVSSPCCYLILFLPFLVFLVSSVSLVLRCV